MAVREAEADGELQAAAWLRALSFYRYPEERKFAAQVHRTMVAEEEVKALKAARMARRLGDAATSGERTTCLVALCPAAVLQAADGQPLDEQLVVQSGGSSGSSAATLAAGGMRERAAAAALAAAEAAGEPLAVVGTLDLYAARAMPGEVLIGDSRNAAYLANVCTAPQARRRGVGNALLAAARELAVSWGTEALYVHTMAVNEIAVRFYERAGFVVEKEETSNQAHYRGRCLDGIEGRGRTVLLRDTRLRG
ncbi:hypothetical protein ABPG77_009300 [Micractinium sp. CCAP 211/92]